MWTKKGNSEKSTAQRFSSSIRNQLARISEFEEGILREALFCLCYFLPSFPGTYFPHFGSATDFAAGTAAKARSAVHLCSEFQGEHLTDQRWDGR